MAYPDSRRKTDHRSIAAYNLDRMHSAYIDSGFLLSDIVQSCH